MDRRSASLEATSTAAIDEVVLRDDGAVSMVRAAAALETLHLFALACLASLPLTTAGVARHPGYPPRHRLERRLMRRPAARARRAAADHR